MSIHERIKEMRTGKELIQEELAKIIGVSRSTLANWEINVTPGHTALKKLAEYFNVSIDYLLNGTSNDLLPGGKVVIYVENDKIVDISELPPNARKCVEDYIQYIKTQYLNKK